MTIEEKAKAYDETIKKAKELKEKIMYSHLSTESCKAVSEYIDTIIPELAESEDERICKRCIDLLRKVSAYSGKEYLGVEIADCIIGLQALMKKQKAPNARQRLAEWSKTKEGKAKYEAVAKEMRKEMEKEQKPEDRFEEAREKYQVEWSEDWREEDIQTRFAFYTYKEDSSVLYLSNVFVEEASRNHGFGTKILMAAEKVAETIGATTISLKVKQDSPANAWYRKRGYGYVAFEDGYDWLEKNLEYMKPNHNILPIEQQMEAAMIAIRGEMPFKSQEWSKEDKEMLQGCINSVEYELLDNGMDDEVKTDPRIAWLKNLPERFNLQPKEEWSEEEKMNIELLIALLRGKVNLVEILDSRKESIINFLKSLRPSWRPSEEQMNALRVTIDFMPDTFKPRCTLVTLLNGLEKLI